MARLMISQSRFSRGHFLFATIAAYFTILSLNNMTTSMYVKDFWIFHEPSIGICPAMSPNLEENVAVVENITMEEVEQIFSSSVKLGGSWWPKECLAQSSIAIIVPFKDRMSQVAPFLNHMHPFLQRQQLNYTIYIVQQDDNSKFNKGMLMNIGFVESLKDGSYDCYIFHDIDFLPEKNTNLYQCTSMPRLLVVSASNGGYQEMYSRFFGGASMLTGNHFQMVNGWCNSYWEWGSEDDDMFERITRHKLSVWRYPKEIARYYALPHKHRDIHPEKEEHFQEIILHMEEDGLNSLEYKLNSKEKKGLFTEIKAKVNLTEISLSYKESP